MSATKIDKVRTTPAAFFEQTTARGVDQALTTGSGPRAQAAHLYKPVNERGIFPRAPSGKINGAPEYLIRLAAFAHLWLNERDFPAPGCATLDLHLTS
ncbi:MAG TPA: hypothetical protein VFQ87_16950, partial [Bradyrhizobium sp.]|nr:hypothetical protein [Bradyrhizobium sp.]